MVYIYLIVVSADGPRTFEKHSSSGYTPIVF